MNGKQLISSVLKHETASRVPWVPFAGIHAGILKGYTAIEVLMDGDKLLESLLEVNKLYRPDGQPIMFDLQLEAEVLGCELYWIEDGPPSVKTHPLAGTDEIPSKIPSKEDGRFPIVLDVMRKMKKKVGEHTSLYGLICGPFTLASHLRGTDIFLDMVKKPDYVKSLLEYTTKVTKEVVDFYIEAGMDVIAIVDPLISQLGPKQFTKFCEGPFGEVFDYIREQKVFSSFFVCGNAIRNLEGMCLTRPDGISIDENIKMETAKEITDRYNIVLSGNIPLTTTMLFGNQQDNMKYVIDLMDGLNHHNLIISPGCDMPYAVPPQNVIAAAQAVYEPELVREMIKNYISVDDSIVVDLPNYKELERPLVEVFTLDSASCAACTYMWGVAMDAKRHFGDRIDVIEYKYTIRENIARTKKMGVANLPSIYINGEIKYSSIIPDQTELFGEIEKLLS